MRDETLAVRRTARPESVYCTMCRRSHFTPMPLPGAQDFALALFMQPSVSDETICAVCVEIEIKFSHSGLGFGNQGMCATASHHLPHSADQHSKEGHRRADAHCSSGLLHVQIEVRQSRISQTLFVCTTLLCMTHSSVNIQHHHAAPMQTTAWAAVLPGCV